MLNLFGRWDVTTSYFFRFKTEHDQHVFLLCSPFFFRHENLFFESVNHINQPINQTIHPQKKKQKKIRCNINDFQIELSEYLTNFHFNYHRFFCQSFIRCFRHSKVSRFPQTQLSPVPAVWRGEVGIHPFIPWRSWNDSMTMKRFGWIFLKETVKVVKEMDV